MGCTIYLASEWKCLAEYQLSLIFFSKCGVIYSRSRLIWRSAIAYRSSRPHVHFDVHRYTTPLLYSVDELRLVEKSRCFTQYFIGLLQLSIFTFQIFKKRRGSLGDTWYMDEVYIVAVRGERRYLWLYAESVAHLKSTGINSMVYRTTGNLW